jgi:LysM repeat protein
MRVSNTKAKGTSMQITIKTLLASLGCALLLSAPALAESYTIQKGDSLYKIARAHKVTVRAIVDANSIQNPDLIYAGQVLQIPGTTANRPAETNRPAPRPTTPRPPATRPDRPTTTPIRKQVASRRKVYKLGGNKLGAQLVRQTTSRYDRDTASFETETAAEVMVLNRKKRVFRLQRGVEGRSLQRSPKIDRSFSIELLGTNRISVGKQFSRSFYVTAFRIPVPVGPLVLDLKTSIGTTMNVGASFPLAWSSRRGYGMNLYGSSGLGAKVSLERSVIVANAGVEARIDLIRATLPARTQLKLSGVDFDVNLILGSHASVSVFAEVGISRFKKRFRVGVPFMSWTFAQRSIPIMHGSIGLGARR